VKIGINADAGRLDGNLALLKEDLGRFQALGFTHAEISVHGVGAMVNGALLPERVKEVCRMLAGFDLQYTVHAPNPLNLMSRADPATEKRLLASSIQFAGAIGAEILVCHSGRYRPEEHFGLPRHSLSPQDEERLWEAEALALQELSPVAASCGVRLCLENARPYLDGSPYCYAERLDELLRMVRTVDRENVGVTLDAGHAYLSARFYGFDFLQAVRDIRPFIRHIHLHDNFGKACASYEKKQYELVASGRGDLHLPPGWGEIPMREMFELLVDYSGVVLLELRPRYNRFLPEALENARSLCAFPATSAVRMPTVSAGSPTGG